MNNNSDYIKNANDIWNDYDSGRMLPELTESSTGESWIVIIPQSYPPSCDPTILIPIINMHQTVETLIDYQVQGYVFSKEDARVTRSIHKRYLKDAKSNLIKLISEQKFPSIDDKAVVINAFGDALNSQIDQHSKVFEKNIRGGMPIKLKEIGLHLYDNGKLYDKYNSLNPYYNASKHRDTKEHKKKLKHLYGIRGTKITIEYFETVRRIFKWYYRNSPGGVPKWDELEKIDYRPYGIYYVFRYKKRWI
jgi:hypothetical protein